MALVLVAMRCSAQNAVTQAVKAGIPPRDEIWYSAVYQEADGNLKHLKGDAYVNTSEMKISADQIDFDTDTDWAYAHGHVHMDHYATGDKINADHGEYNLRTDEGKFFVVSGTSPAKILTSPGILTTTNPFYFEAASADRFKDRYVLHHGFLTDCKMPKPWWRMQSPLFNVVPGNRAYAKNAVFRLRRFPIFYLPYYYRPLGRNPRQSGFLTPDFGHSSQFGWIYGAGYYWAINRSYDMTGVVEDFSQRGPAYTYDFRGKPNDVTSFNFHLYDVDDSGASGIDPLTGKQIKTKQGGLEFELTGSTKIFGFTGRADYNYLSSYTFRQVFSYSFATAIYNEVSSVGFLQRRFDHDTYSLSLVLQRNQDYLAATDINQPQNQVVVQKLPSIEASGREQEIVKGPLPVWFSFGASAGLLTRDEATGTESLGSPTATFATGAIGRLDVQPHVYTNFNWKGFSLTPGITLGATAYSDSYSENSTTYTAASCGYPACPPTPTTAVALGNGSLFRRDADFTLELRTPTLERVYKPAAWLHLGAKVKHTIEAGATYENVTGVDQFAKTILFDDMDILANTRQLTLSVTNRLYRKDKAGNVSELLRWRVSQARYFDPTFGGAVRPGQRAVIAESVDFSPYAFLYGPRNESPVDSLLVVNPYSWFALEWREEYDPVQSKMIVNSFTTNYRRGKFFGNVGETSIRTNPLLFPQSNQLSYGGGYGSYNRKGWNVAATELYDVLLKRGVFEFIQGSYNTDCCGFSVQYRRINFGIRDENQYLFSFSLANLGTFGSLQKQERLF